MGRDAEGTAMTVAELEQRLASVEAELILLRHEVLRLKGVTVIPGFGPVGTFKNDPTFPDAVRFGREYRDQVNRESLEEFDREQAEAAKKRAVKKRPRPRKTDARP
jgi:hypothetical protein